MVGDTFYVPLSIALCKLVLEIFNWVERIIIVILFSGLMVGIFVVITSIIFLFLLSEEK